MILAYNGVIAGRIDILGKSWKLSFEKHRISYLNNIKCFGNLLMKSIIFDTNQINYSNSLEILINNILFLSVKTFKNVKT